MSFLKKKKPIDKPPALPVPTFTITHQMKSLVSRVAGDDLKLDLSVSETVRIKVNCEMAGLILDRENSERTQYLQEHSKPITGLNFSLTRAQAIMLNSALVECLLTHETQVR